MPVLLVVLFAGAAAWFWLYYVPRERAAAIDSWSRDLDHRADVRREALQRYFTDRLADAATFASYSITLGAVAPQAAGFAGQPASAAVERGYLQELLDGFVRAHDVLDIVLWDAATRPVAKSSDLVPEDACTEPARKVLSSGRPAAGFHEHPGFGPVLTFAAPVRSADGRIRGVVVVAVDPRKWVYPILAQPFAAASTGETILIARDGADAVYLSPLRHQPDAALHYRQPLDTPGIAARAALEGSEVVGFYVDYRGVRVLAAGHRLPPSPWALVVKVDEDEVLADFRGRTWRTGIGGAATLIAVLGVAWGVWQRRERSQLAALAQSATRVRQLNRLLRTITEINRLIVHADDRETLLSEACRVLVEHGGFRMVWIGFVDPGTLRVVPAVRAGEGKEYLDGIEIRVDDSAEGGEQVGTAIQTGRHVVAGDIAADPVESPWRERQLAYGFRSAGAFPLRVRGDVVGALRIYAAEPSAISEEETTLLDELATDLAYALEALDDRAERRRAEEALAKSERYYRSLLEHALDITIVLGSDGRLRYVSSSVERVLGYKPSDLSGRNAFDLVHPEDRPLVEERLRRILESGTGYEAIEARFQHRDGSWRVLSVIGKLLPPEVEERGLIVNAHDLTKRQQLEAQLLHSQKLEAVGRLAGGVAHDFNNLLTVIQGYGEMLSAKLVRDETQREEMAEILKAADRAATLTRQLLAFSRRQVLEMRVLDLGAVVGETEKMLRRLIGEQIDLVVIKGKEPSLVKADSGQIEQILANLVVNARDAMPTGGPLTIEVANLDLDASLAAQHETVPPGHYVVLSVCDTGSGMESETLARIFEPFFTTKTIGKGTGLGLSTVYGIVKQSGGFLTVESEPAKGTTFRIFFPRVDGENAVVEPKRRTEAPSKGSETILVVEDEEQIRALVRASLRAQGYTVLDAASAEEALSLSARHEGPLELLLTDVVLVGDSGRELARRLLGQRPGLKVLYMSGHTDNAISHQGVLETGLAFLQKPFTPAVLAGKVRETLEGRSPGDTPSP